jgi:hypothetical protein
MGMKRLSSCSIKAERASEAVQITAEQGWHRVMFSDVIGKGVALHRVACSSKGTLSNGNARVGHIAMAQPEIRRLDLQRLISQALAGRAADPLRPHPCDDD